MGKLRDDNKNGSIWGGLAFLAFVIIVGASKVDWSFVQSWAEHKSASRNDEQSAALLKDAFKISKSDQAHLQEAINELQRLNSALEIGTTLNDYTRLLNDVHAKVQTHLDSLPEFNAETGAGLGASAISSRIENCLNAFVRVHTVWKDMIFGDKWHKGEKAYSMSSGEGKANFDIIANKMNQVDESLMKDFVRSVVSNGENLIKPDIGYLFWYPMRLFKELKDDSKQL